MTIQEEIQNGESRTLEDKTTLPHDSQNRAGGKFVFNVKVENEDIKYLCKDFSERAERRITRKDLENLNLIIGNKKDTATNAYAILLGKHDYTSRIQCARFRGTERVDFLDKKEYEGPLCEHIDGAYKFVLNYLSMAVEINGIVHKKSMNFLTRQSAS